MNKKSLEMFKMSKAQMNNVNGGISRKEYCQNLYDVVTHNSIHSDDGASAGFNEGWSSNKCYEFVKEFQAN
jgi:hypothetical protein